MTCIVYYQDVPLLVNAPTLNGEVIGEPILIPRYVLVGIMTQVPDGTTKEMVKEKWGSIASTCALEFCSEDDCPDDLKEQVEEPDPEVLHRVWTRI